MNPKALKRIANTSDGKALRVYLARKVIALDSVSDITSSDPMEIAVEVRAKDRARELILEVLKDIVTLQDIQEVEAEPSEYGMWITAW